ncbi:MAG: iron-containing redox enzyme family protein [Thermodesulfobacteriota bacterium]
MDARTSSLPSWLRDVVASVEPAKRRVAEHEVWRRMRAGTITRREQRNVLVGFWPLIERFPGLLALNLVKTSYGRDAGQNAARSWLARNLRTEQKHAEWFLDWAEGCGITRDEMLDGRRPTEMTLVTDWSWRVCESGGLAEAMAATNYAIEGVTGEWTPGVAASAAYRASLVGEPRKAMRWLDAHASYDDEHPWQALAIVAQLAGPEPGPSEVRTIREAIVRSYELYALALDAALRHAHADGASACGAELATGRRRADARPDDARRRLQS